jgi:hypothetical protein
MLEFFRRAAPERPDEPAPSAPSLEPTTRMLVLRRSQAIVAGCAAAATLLLAFLVGHAVGSSGGDSGVVAREVFVIRAVAYGDDEQGLSFARKTKEELDKLNLGDEVQVVRVPSESRTVVAVGSWLSDPLTRKDARDLRDKLRAWRDTTKATPFANADFWRMER